MIYDLLKLAHVIGTVLIGAGLIGVWINDLQSRQTLELVRFSESVRNIAIFYDGLVVPGAIILLISGTWMIAAFYGGWNFIAIPWLAWLLCSRLNSSKAIPSRVFISCDYAAYLKNPWLPARLHLI
jgi:uncharacterized membrane protein